MARSGKAFGLLCTAVLIVSMAAGRARARTWLEEDFWRRPPKVYAFNPPGGGPLDQVATVVGQTRTYQPEKGDTFLDVARYFDIGFNEIADANPDSDEWIPATIGKPLTIPQEFVLPCCTYSGIVINIPEMRLYYYPARKGPGPHTVLTFPVGLGREDWRTPVAKFAVREKNVNPAWVIPDSIRKERIADKGFSETMIPGGREDNPLGKYRMRLSLNLYGIHGTNIPWGVGMLVSHGCVRLYPEDIERFFPMVPVKTQGEFVYQTVKIGLRGGRVYVEVHKDLYGTQPGPWRQAIAELKRQKLLDRVDERKLLRTVEAQSGVPTDVSRGPAGREPALEDLRPGLQPARTAARNAAPPAEADGAAREDGLDVERLSRPSLDRRPGGGW